MGVGLVCSLPGAVGAQSAALIGLGCQRSHEGVVQAREGFLALEGKREILRQTPSLKPQPPEGLNPPLVTLTQSLNSYLTLRG